jgi:hypothetical protein
MAESKTREQLDQDGINLDIRVTALEAASGGSLPSTWVVAANDSSSSDKAIADYVCDGTADNSEIQSAINAAQSNNGGTVLLAKGTYNVASTVIIAGNDDPDDPNPVQLRGVSQLTTFLNGARNVDVLSLRNCAQAHISDLTIKIAGSGSGLVATNPGATSGRTFSESSFRSLHIDGGYVTSNTGWGIKMTNPFRSTFENLAVYGVRGGIRFSNTSAFNPGDFTVIRCFVELVGTNGIAYNLTSTVTIPEAYINQVEFIMCEAIADGSSGTTGIKIDPSTFPHTSTRWRGINLEQFATAIDVFLGNQNQFDCNYVEVLASGTVFKTGANSTGNVFTCTEFYARAAATLINDANTDTDLPPNTFGPINIEDDTGANVTGTIQSATLLRGVTRQNWGGTVSASLLAPPLRPSPRPMVTTVTSAASHTPNIDNTDQFIVTAQAAAVTFNAPKGNASEGQKLTIRIKDNGTARAITWNAAYVSSGVASLITTTVAGKSHLIGFVYDDVAGLWVCVAADATGY